MRNLVWLAALVGLSCAHRIDPAALRLEGRQDLDITRHEILNTPTQVRGRLADLSGIKKTKRSAPLLQLVQENQALFKLRDPGKELQLLESKEDDLGFTHYRFARMHAGVPVHGDELLMHVNDKSEVYQVNGFYHPSITAKNEPAVSAEQAGAVALEQGTTHKMETVEKSALIYYPAGEELRLAWQVTLRGGMNRWEYFIDALDSKVLFDQDRRRF